MTNEQLLKNLTPPGTAADVVLDTDTYNEIDDQYAIAYLLKSFPKENIKGFYAAPFSNSKAETMGEGMEKSYLEILKVLTLAGYSDLENITFKGSLSSMPDDNTPVDSPAARHLISLAKNYSTEKPLYVIGIGAITNVASALLIDPSIKENIVVVWLGMNATHWVNNEEFNCNGDITAARVLLKSGVPLVLLPANGVVDRLLTTAPELTYWLKGKNPLADYLVQNTIDEAESYAKGKAWSRVIWDISAVAWLMNNDSRFMNEIIDYYPIPGYDRFYGKEMTPNKCKIVYKVNRDSIFSDLFNKLI